MSADANSWSQSFSILLHKTNTFSTLYPESERNNETEFFLAISEI
jgi:hypothetical protein